MGIWFIHRDRGSIPCIRNYFFLIGIICFFCLFIVMCISDNSGACSFCQCLCLLIDGTPLIVSILLLIHGITSQNQTFIYIGIALTVAFTLFGMVWCIINYFIYQMSDSLLIPSTKDCIIEEGRGCLRIVKNCCCTVCIRDQSN